MNKKISSVKPYQKDIDQAVEVLRKGGIILYPTDTIWGLGCDATNEQAVERIFQIKKRSSSKALLILLDDLSKLTEYAYVPSIAWELIKAANRPLTIIYPQAKNLAKNLIAQDGSIGIRIVRDNFCKDLIRQFGKPIVSTSANISGTRPPQNFSEISPQIKEAVDYIVRWRQNDNRKFKPSSIIKLGKHNEIEIIRD
jgi:L-threonylcarbamoyladenylate synthase